MSFLDHVPKDVFPSPRSDYVIALITLVAVIKGDFFQHDVKLDAFQNVAVYFGLKAFSPSASSPLLRVRIQKKTRLSRRRLPCS